MMSRVIQMFQDSGRVFHELCYATSIRPNYTCGDLGAGLRGLPANVAICGEVGQQLHLADVVEQAKRVFEKVCPEQPFPLSQSSFASNAENDGGDEGEQDAEETYLEATLKAAAAASTVASPTSSETDI